MLPHLTHREISAGRLQTHSYCAQEGLLQVNNGETAAAMWRNITILCCGEVQSAQERKRYVLGSRFTVSNA